jgi:hypothetical protein
MVGLVQGHQPPLPPLPHEGSLRVLQVAIVRKDQEVSTVFHLSGTLKTKIPSSTIILRTACMETFLQTGWRKSLF